MKERRSGRVGTVSGLGLLTGATAVAAVAGGSHSVYSTVLLGLLTLGLGHSLAVELRRQARRRSAAGWSRHDTTNAVLLGVCSEAATVFAIWGTGRLPLQIVGVTLAVAYAVACAHFVTERRRAVAAQLTEQVPPTGTEAATDAGVPARGTAEPP